MRRSHSLAIDDDDLAGFDIAQVRRADDVQRAGLGGEHEGVAELAHGERTPAARIANGHEGVPQRDDQAVRPFDAVEGFGHAVFGFLRRRSGEPVHDDLGVVRRSEDRTLVLELDREARRSW